MNTARRDGLYCLLFGILAFLTLGAAFGANSPGAMQDFKVLYYPARCLLQHGDPYNAEDVARVYLKEDAAPKTPKSVQIITKYIYLPTSFLFSIPFALLPWGTAHLLWLALTACSLIAASLLIWTIGAEHAPILSGILLGILLAGGEVILILCNAAGIAVAFCAIGTWCFIREKVIPLGILCFAMSLALKPHDSGLIWLYFLLAGGVYRKRALQTLITLICLSAPTVLWMWRASPNWRMELQHNLLSFSVRGGLADPTPAMLGSRGGGVMINLQTAVSLLGGNPHFYDSVTYLVCGVLFVFLAILIVRRGRTEPWPAIAALSALSMLPLYHHLFDAKLLVLMVPACAIVWAKRAPLRSMILTVSTFAILATTDLAWAIFLALTHGLHPAMTSASGQIFLAAQILPAPLSLLAAALSYTYICLYSSRSARGVSA